MKKIKVKKIWNNRVSVKNTDLVTAIKKGGLIIVFEGLQMTINADLCKYKLAGNPDSKPIKSKFNNSPPYTLYDFQWKPEKKVETKINMQGELL